MANGHGGPRPNSGRKSRAEELGLKEKLQPMEADFLAQLAEQVKAGNPMAMKMFAEYFYGKPVETHEHGGIGGGAIMAKHVVEFRNYAGNDTD